MDELQKRRDEVNNELQNLPRERDNALRDLQMRNAREEQGMSNDYRMREANLRRELTQLDTEIRSAQRPVGSIF